MPYVVGSHRATVSVEKYVHAWVVRYIAVRSLYCMCNTSTIAHALPINVCFTINHKLMSTPKVDAWVSILSNYLIDQLIQKICQSDCLFVQQNILYMPMF